MASTKANKPRPEAGSSINQYILALPFVAIMVLVLVGPLLPGRLTWGINFMSIFSPAVAVAVAALAVVISAPPVATRIANLLRSIFDGPGPVISRINRPLVAVVTSVAATLVLYYWRSRAFVYGDGYIVLTDASSGDELTLLGQNYVQILTVYLNHYVYELLSTITEWSAEEIIGLSNAVGGMVGLWAVYRISGQLSKNAVTRAFIFLGGLSSASVVLFFGYIENYTWAFSVGLWTLSLSVGYVRKENGAVPLIVTAVLSAMLHLITLPIAVVGVMSLFIRREAGVTYFVRVPLKYVNGALTACSLVLVILSQILDIGIFVPLFPVESNPYSVLSSDHVIDVLNQLALAAPLGVFLVMLSMFYRKEWQRTGTLAASVLGTSALLLLLAAFWIDPELGAPRDWDLLSLYGLPLTIWGLYRFTGYFADGRVGLQWLVGAVAVVAVTLVPNLYEKNNPDLAVSRLDALLYTDPHYQATYHNAERCEPWAVTLQKGHGDWRVAIKYLQRRIAVEPTSHNAHYNLSDSYYFLGIHDSAYMHVSYGLRLKPDDVDKMLNASTVAYKLRRYSDAAAWAQKALQRDSTNVKALSQMGVALVHAGRIGESLPGFRRAFDLEPGTYEHIVNMGMAHALTKNADSAYYYYRKALAIAPNDKRASVYFCLITLGIDMARFEEAANYMNALRQIDPNSPEVIKLGAKLEEARKR